MIIMQVGQHICVMKIGIELIMKSILLIVFLLYVSGCSSSSERLKEKKESLERESKTYTITCNMPVNIKKSFKVDYENAINPFHTRSGIWRFTTVEGKRIKSTHCHLEM